MGLKKMQSTKYFCNVCFKTYAEYYESGKLYIDRKCTTLTPKDSPLTTGKCDNCETGSLKVV